jgi:hypothetical protein
MNVDSHVDAKAIYKDKLQVAIENLRQAEIEGAEEIAPDTYAWAKQKIYDDKKILLQYPDDDKKVEEASDDACAAAAKLLSIVRRHIRSENQTACDIEQSEKEALQNLANEGPPVT